VKLSALVVLLIAALDVLSPPARADDAADVTKVARDFVAALVSFDFDKVQALGRPGDAGAFPGPPEELLRQFRDVEKLPQVQDLRRQIADELPKAVALTPPALTPDGSCAIIMASPVTPELRHFCELMALYLTYTTTAEQAKAQGLPTPKVEDIRARIETPGSPEQLQIKTAVESFSKMKPVRLQFEKTTAGWRANLRALATTVKDLDEQSP
jgi:hypothetical protein